MPITPRITLHAGRPIPKHLNPESYHLHRAILLHILSVAHARLLLVGDSGNAVSSASALEVATYVVSELENCTLFNCGRGSAFTRDGGCEGEASVVLSRVQGVDLDEEGGGGGGKRGKRRSAAVAGVQCMKNPILVAKEMLVRGYAGEQTDGGGGREGGGGRVKNKGEGHVFAMGVEIERLAREEWGCEAVGAEYYWTALQWQRHRHQSGLEANQEIYERLKREAAAKRRGDGERETGGGGCDGGDDVHFDQADCVGVGPYDDGKGNTLQGGVGCVVLDAEGLICVATSSGGPVNKVPGKIGEAATLGAGSFAKEWLEERPSLTTSLTRADLSGITRSVLSFPRDARHKKQFRHAVGVCLFGSDECTMESGAARTACELTWCSSRRLSLARAISHIIVPKGMPVHSAAERNKNISNAQGGMIGIEYRRGASKVVAEFNSDGMFRAWVDEKGEHRMMVYHGEYTLRSAR